MSRRTLDKALRIRSDPQIYGTIGDGGAGLEVGRVFFYTGASSGSFGRAVSNDAASIADALYGEGDRTATLLSLERTLSEEYAALEVTVRPERSDARFFAFADTMAVHPYGGSGDEYHGWMGVVFQPSLDVSPLCVTLQLRLLDPTAPERQSALGVLGINLLYGCLFQSDAFTAGRPTAVAVSDAGLLDDVIGRVVIDAVLCDASRPSVDSRRLSSGIVSQGLTPVVVFDVESFMTSRAETPRQADGDVLCANLWQPRASAAVMTSTG